MSGWTLATFGPNPQFLTFTPTGAILTPTKQAGSLYDTDSLSSSAGWDGGFQFDQNGTFLTANGKQLSLTTSKDKATAFKTVSLPTLGDEGDHGYHIETMKGNQCLNANKGKLSLVPSLPTGTALNFLNFGCSRFAFQFTRGQQTKQAEEAAADEAQYDPEEIDVTHGHRHEVKKISKLIQRIERLLDEQFGSWEKYETEDN